MSRWYRAYEGTVTDAKFGEVALVAECSRSVAISAWHCILESAAASNKGGQFDTTPRRVAVILGEPVAVIERVFAEMTEMGMIADGSVCAWKARQYESDTSTERSRKHRERKRNGEAAGCNGDATLQGRCATPPDTETDIPLSNDNGPKASDKAFWDNATAFLTSNGSKNARPIIGKWVKAHGKDATAQAITAAQIERPVEVVAYIEGVFRRGGRSAANGYGPGHSGIPL